MCGSEGGYGEYPSFGVISYEGSARMGGGNSSDEGSPRAWVFDDREVRQRGGYSGRLDAVLRLEDLI
jgi:hypothetical protein